MEQQDEQERREEERATEREEKDTEIEIQLATKQEPKENFEKGLVSLVRAFENDPFFNYLNRTPGNRDKLIYHFFRCYFVARPELIRFIGDWQAIGHWAIVPDQDVSVMTFLGNGGLISLWNSANWYSTIRILLEEEYKRHKYMADAKKYFYLQILATDPDAQGKGYGGRLVKQLTDEADEKGWPCYLETANEKARDLYARYGFVVLEDYHVTKGAPTVWLMRRDVSKPE